MHGRHPSGPDRRIHERDAGLRRLRRATVVALAAAGALTALFGELAAKAFPGRSSTSARHVVRRPVTTTRARAVATPPPLVSSGAVAQPAPPAQVQSQAPPVVVSGGT